MWPQMSSRKILGRKSSSTALHWWDHGGLQGGMKGMGVSLLCLEGSQVPKLFLMRPVLKRYGNNCLHTYRSCRL